jgi:hypothetical protein
VVPALAAFSFGASDSGLRSYSAVQKSMMSRTNGIEDEMNPVPSLGVYRSAYLFSALR